MKQKKNADILFVDDFVIISMLFKCAIARKERWFAKTLHRRGFTLIELLITVAIIMVLIAILLPALNSARERAYSTTCLNNYKQQQIALADYLHTSNDMFPARLHPTDNKINKDRWWGDHIWMMEDFIPKGRVIQPSSLIRPFDPGLDSFRGNSGEAGKSIPLGWVCPAHFRIIYEPNFVGAYSLRFHRFGVVQMHNAVRTGSAPINTPVLHRVSRLPSPASYTYMGETGWEPLVPNKFDEHASTPYMYGVTTNGEYGNYDGFMRYGHRKGFSVAYLDGHVKFHGRKRTAQKDLFSSKVYASRVVDTLDQ